MGIHIGSGKSFPAGWSTAAKPCDSCKSVAALLFCRVDSAFLCTGCDSRIHVANGHGHERVWMCEVCEQAPASVTCKADAAALCVTCDRDIHSANPLAHRHERIPAVPFYENTAVKSAVTAADDDEHSNKKDQTTAVDVEDHEGEEEVPDSWIDLSNSCAKLFPEAPEMKSIDYLFSESDQLLDLDYPISLNTRFQHNLGTDSVVPIQTFKTPPPNQIIDHNHFEIDFTHSKLNPYKSLTQSVSSSSMDVGIVPDGGSMSEMSYNFTKYSNSAGIDLSDSGNTTVNQASQLTGMDREARVLRYREKRKNRKFEKTIRYASRKAYAEMRPRIKGRFAKRTEIDSEVDHLFTSSSSAFMPDSGYGVVPSY